jgi:hypothetical protein
LLFRRVKDYAIHGSPSVPGFSGEPWLIRIPIFAAAEFSKPASMEMVVVVYDKTQISLSRQ